MARRTTKKKDLTPEEKLAQALVPVDKIEYTIPQNWCWVVLGKIIGIKRGASPRPIKAYITEGKGVNWIKIGDADEGKYINQTKERITYEGAEKSVFVEKGTLLLSNSMSFGRPYVLNVSGCIHDGWLAITPNSATVQDFLYYGLLSSQWYFERVAVGTAVRNLNSDRVAATPFPLPPLPEQQRIVARIESLFAKLDEAKEKTQAVVDGFEERKAAILHKAFTGELTKRWREERGIESKCEYVTVDSVCKSLKYGTARKSAPEGTVVVIRMGNLQQGEIDWRNLVYSTDEDDNQKYRLSAGDVLFNRTNSPEWVGKTSIYRGEYPAIYAGYLIKLDYDHSILEGEYLNYILNTPEAKEYCNRVKTDGVNQSNINAKKIGAFSFPLPSLTEQQQIISTLHDLLDKQQQAKSAAEQVLDQIDTMKKAILARAFRGELGTNDPQEESAVELVRRALSKGGETVG